LKVNDKHIDIQTIEKYLKGTLSADKKAKVDALRKRDPFVDEAISGYEKNPESIRAYRALEKRYHLTQAFKHWYFWTGGLIATVSVLVFVWMQNKSESTQALQSYNNHSLVIDSVKTKPSHQLLDVVLQRNQEPKEALSVQLQYKANVLKKESTAKEVVKDTVLVSLKKEEKQDITIPVKKESSKEIATYAHLNIGLYFRYTREFILKTYLASRAVKNDTNRGKTKTQEGLRQLNDYMQKGELKKALAMIEKDDTGYTIKNNEAMNEWVDIITLIQKNNIEQGKEKLVVLKDLPQTISNHSIDLLRELSQQ